MGKRCRKCNVPLEGFGLWIASIFGVRRSKKEANLCSKCEKAANVPVQGKPIGKITHYFSHLSVGIIELTGTLKVGDRILIKGHTSDFKQNVDSMQIEHKNVTEGKAGDAIGIKVSRKVHVHDIVYKI